MPLEHPVIRTVLAFLAMTRILSPTGGRVQRLMRAVTFQAPGEVRIDERPEPELSERDEAIVRVEASGICGSDLHIYHGRVQIDPGFTIGHEYVGEVVAAGDEVTGVAVGDRVLGTYGTACGKCFFCDRGEFHKCD